MLVAYEYRILVYLPEYLLYISLVHGQNTRIVFLGHNRYTGSSQLLLCCERSQTLEESDASLHF